MRLPNGLAYADNIFILIAGLSVYQLQAGSPFTPLLAAFLHANPIAACWASAQARMY